MLEAKPKCQGLVVSKRGDERGLRSACRERQELVCHAGQRCAGHGVSTVRAAAGSHGTHPGPAVPSRAPLRCLARALWLCFSAGFLHAPLGADPELPGKSHRQRRREGNAAKPWESGGSGEDCVPAFPGQLRPAHGLPLPPAPPAASVLPATPGAASPLPPTLPDGGPWL